MPKLKITQISCNVYIISDYVQTRRRLVGNLLEVKSKKGLVRISDAIQTLYVKDWATDENFRGTQVFGSKFEFRIFWTWNGRAIHLNVASSFAFDHICTGTNRLEICVKISWLNLYSFNLSSKHGGIPDYNAGRCITETKLGQWPFPTPSLIANELIKQII